MGDIEFRGHIMAANWVGVSKAHFWEKCVRFALFRCTRFGVL